MIRLVAQQDRLADPGFVLFSIASPPLAKKFSSPSISFRSDFFLRVATLSISGGKSVKTSSSFQPVSQTRTKSVRAFFIKAPD
jgi:hypothetical protein